MILASELSPIVVEAEEGEIFFGDDAAHSCGVPDETAVSGYTHVSPDTMCHSQSHVVVGHARGDDTAEQHCRAANKTGASACQVHKQPRRGLSIFFFFYFFKVLNWFFCILLNVFFFFFFFACDCQVNLLSHQLLQFIENSHILPDLQFFINNGTSNVSSIRLPTIYNFLPHFLNDPNSLRPAFVQSKGRQGVSMVLGVPTVKREVQSYLLATLKNLLDRMSPAETADTIIIVLVAEVNSQS